MPFHTSGPLTEPRRSSTTAPPCPVACGLTPSLILPCLCLNTNSFHGEVHSCMGHGVCTFSSFDTSRTCARDHINKNNNDMYFLGYNQLSGLTQLQVTIMTSSTCCGPLWSAMAFLYLQGSVFLHFSTQPPLVSSALDMTQHSGQGQAMWMLSGHCSTGAFACTPCCNPGQIFCEEVS
jgi:hypothetical protein